MTRAVLSIGSNQGDRLAHLRAARQAFAAELQAASPVVQTPPWGPVAQPAFLNAILIVDDSCATAAEWLRRARTAETAAGRVRTLRWGPRTLDVDIVTVSDGERQLVSADPELTLPHPRAAERGFVLLPWQLIEPEAVLAGRTVASLLAAVDVSGIVVRPELTLERR